MLGRDDRISLQLPAPRCRNTNESLNSILAWPSPLATLPILLFRTLAAPTSELGLKASPVDFSRFSPLFSWQIPGPSMMLALWYRKLGMSKVPFDGILGFSSGAAMAATYLLRQVSTHQSALFQFAVFICGGAGFDTAGARLFWPMKVIAESALYLSTFTGIWVGLLYMASPVLYNTRVRDSRRLLDHGKGNVMPWGWPSTKALANLILELFRKTT